MKSLFLIFLLIAFTSCGEKAKKSSAKFSVNLSALTGGAANATGGVLLAGGKVDDTASFSKAYKVGDPDPVIELDNGKWHFYLVTWDGASILTGSTKCAYSGVKDLNGSDTIVSFNLTTTFCGENIPTAIGELPSQIYYSTGSWPKVKFYSHLDLPNLDTLGLSKSYRAHVQVETKGINLVGPYALSSACRLMSDEVVLPAGSTTGDDTIFNSTIDFYTSSDCSGASVKYFFHNGVLYNLSTDGFASNHTSTVSGTTGNINVNIEHNPSTPVSYTNLEFFNFGSGKDGATSNASIYTIVTGMTTNTIDVNSISGLVVGDEVMWYVSEDVSAACDSSEFLPGHYGFQRIKAINTLTLSFYGNLREQTFTLPSDFTNCKIQITKVSNYTDISVPTNSFSASPYASANGTGGIIAFRVNGTLTLNDTASISANDKGFLSDSANTSSKTNSNYSHCTPGNLPCLKMGAGDGGTNRGGGVVIAFAKNVIFNRVGNTTEISSSSSLSYGGTSLVFAKNVSGTNAITNTDIFSNSNTGLTAGEAKLFYCDASGATLSNVPSHGSTINSGATKNSSLETERNHLLCP